MAVTRDQVEQWERIVRSYRAGETMAAIADRERVDLKTVYNVARRAGLPNRHRFDPKRTTRIIAAYNAGEPIGRIAEQEGVHRTYVGAVARRAGLPPRKGWQRKYPLDEGAFDRPNAVGWWLIGLLAADGSVRLESNLISLTQREADSDVLPAFLTYVGCPDRPLVELKLSADAARRAWPRSPAFEARIHSKHICEVLGRHGITPRKSKTLKLSERAVREPAVWLGLLDGDGWVSPIGQRGRPLIQYFGTPAVMQQCGAFWGARLKFQRVTQPTVARHRGGLGRVSLHGANAALAAEILLASTPVSLQRKRRSLETIVRGAAGDTR